MNKIYFSVLLSSQLMGMKDCPQHITIDIQEQIVAGHDNKVIIQKEEDKKAKREKIIIAALVGVTTSAITAGVTLAIHLNKCNSP